MKPKWFFDQADWAYRTEKIDTRYSAEQSPEDFVNKLTKVPCKSAHNDKGWWVLVYDQHHSIVAPIAERLAALLDLRFRLTWETSKTEIRLKPKKHQVSASDLRFIEFVFRVLEFAKYEVSNMNRPISSLHSLGHPDAVRQVAMDVFGVPVTQKRIALDSDAQQIDNWLPAIGQWAESVHAQLRFLKNQFPHLGPTEIAYYQQRILRNAIPEQRDDRTVELAAELLTAIRGRLAVDR